MLLVSADEHSTVLTVLDAIETATPHSVAEFIEGTYHVTPAPGGPHSIALSHLIVAVSQVAPPGHVVGTDLRIDCGGDIVIPDLYVAEEAAVRTTTGAESLDASHVLLVAEIISPTSESRDRVHKHRIYIDAGLDYWLVTPTTESGKPWGRIEYHPAPDSPLTDLRLNP